MSFRTSGMSPYAFGMMSQCQKTKMAKGDCGCHPYPQCLACRDVGRVPPGVACPESCQASIAVENTREENRRKRETEDADIATLTARIAELKKDADRSMDALKSIIPRLDEFYVSFLADNGHLPFAELMIENFRPMVDKLLVDIKAIAAMEGRDGDE